MSQLDKELFTPHVILVCYHPVFGKAKLYVMENCTLILLICKGTKTT